MCSDPSDLTSTTSRASALIDYADCSALLVESNCTDEFGVSHQEVGARLEEQVQFLVCYFPKEVVWCRHPSVRVVRVHQAVLAHNPAPLDDETGPLLLDEHDLVQSEVP